MTFRELIRKADRAMQEQDMFIRLHKLVDIYAMQPEQITPIIMRYDDERVDYCLFKTLFENEIILFQFENIDKINTFTDNNPTNGKAISMLVAFYKAIEKEIELSRQEQIENKAYKAIERATQPTNDKTIYPDWYLTSKAQVLFAKLEQEELIEKQSGGGYTWKRTKELLAYFVKRANEYLDLMEKGRYNWVDFEQIFNVSNLATTHHRRGQTANKPPKGYMDIDNIFTRINKRGIS